MLLTILLVTSMLPLLSLLLWLMAATWSKGPAKEVVKPCGRGAGTMEGATGRALWIDWLSSEA